MPAGPAFSGFGNHVPLPVQSDGGETGGCKIADSVQPASCHDKVVGCRRSGHGSHRGGVIAGRSPVGDVIEATDDHSHRWIGPGGESRKGELLREKRRRTQF